MLGRSGIGTYLAELLPRIVASMDPARFTLLGDERALGEVVSPSPRVAFRRCDAPLYSIREQMALLRLIPRDTTLFWAPHYVIPLAYRGPLAVTVHDVAHLVMEDASLAQRAYARGMFGAVRRRAAMIFCDSEHTKGDFLRLVGRPRRVVVAHLGVGAPWTDAVDSPDPSRAPYFLYVGNVKPHKNLVRLIAAFGRVMNEIPHRLVIVGPRDGMRTVDHRVAQRAAALGERVSYTGHVRSSELVTLVRGCDALVLPSLHEGFGLPPLEALACGRAVAVSRTTSLPEVCGALAEYFDPLDVDSIAGALMRLAHRAPDGAALVAARRAWARRFAWESCARTTVEGLVQVMAEPDGEP